MGWVREFEVMCGAVTQFLARSRYSVFTAIIILIVIQELVSITSSSGMFLWWPAWGFLSLCSSRRSGSLNRVVGCLLLPCPVIVRWLFWSLPWQWERYSQSWFKQTWSGSCRDLCSGRWQRQTKVYKRRQQPHWLTVVSRKILTRV